MAAATPVAASVPTQRVPLNVVRQAHAANAATRRLVEDVGLEKLEAFTTRFYEKAFADPKLDAFIRDHGEPHAKRFAAWIFEKLGGGNVWTAERRTRKMCPFSAHGQDFMSAHDRSSAHFAAWHSPKRDPRYGASTFTSKTAASGCACISGRRARLAYSRSIRPSWTTTCGLLGTS